MRQAFRPLGLVFIVFVGCPACDRLGRDGATGKADAGTTLSAASAPNAGVPDACGLVSEQDLTAALGAPPGEGKAMRVLPDRSTCMYSTGLILAVEVARNYEATKKMIESQGRATTPVSGVGETAYWDPAGQLVVKGKKVFV